MKTHVLALALCAMAYAQDAPKPPSAVKITRLDSPKALKFEGVVPAKLDDVWNAFTTDAGLNTWLWQAYTVELRDAVGWTAPYPSGATGRRTTLRLHTRP